ncbi:hypothetical protein GWK47_039708 [Chionoecetes opilio]|uniref:Uncharacterized protein n=1 Tax=Chionoecetes opilio TaxID=41210 RepID=A0A8J4YBA9_CHIOP|nr:hypothetical protein GWK47_039708 [Chionoecetes opilio]
MAAAKAAEGRQDQGTQDQEMCLADASVEFGAKSVIQSHRLCFPAVRAEDTAPEWLCLPALTPSGGIPELMAGNLAKRENVNAVHSVHDNEELSNIQKLTYLKGQLTGEARHIFHPLCSIHFVSHIASNTLSTSSTEDLTLQISSVTPARVALSSAGISVAIHFPGLKCEGSVR